MIHDNILIEDKELGHIIVRINSRAKKLIFRAGNDAIYVTVPYGTTEKEVMNAVESLRYKLQTAQQQLPEQQKIDFDFCINTPLFKLSLSGGGSDKFLAQSTLGEMKILCPPTVNFDNMKLQEWLRKVIEEALRRNAKEILPQRLCLQSIYHGLPFNKVKINSSRGRWGSCSGKRDVNLSFFLLLLPQHLIDYVLLHELCHTREMNHGDRFWELLNLVTDNQAFALREELNGYKTDIW